MLSRLAWAIVTKYHEKLIEKLVPNFAFVRSTLDSLVNELKPILSDEQIKKLEDRRQFMHPRMEGIPPLYEKRFQRPFDRRNSRIRPGQGGNEQPSPFPSPPDEK